MKRISSQSIHLRGLASVATVLAAGLVSIHAALVDVGPGNITPAATVITFDTPLGTVNPSYTFNNVPGIGTETVSFAGTFAGQTPTTGFPVTLSDSQPSNPLALNLSGPTTFVTNDGASDTNPVLSGSPEFNGPISMFFSKPVAGVALKGGYFDNPHSTSVEAYDASGKSLGILSNNVTGFEFYGLADSTGKADISGLSFFVTGNEPFGFEIDNVTFGAAQAFSPVPEPSTIILILSVGAGVALVTLRQRFVRPSQTA
ncbi:MAG: PEP-CTERM sorting domain-containing protein [Verrucomicrobia bacterium]|nr:PEP-CTERM sorting domain-containing protein [Verrucomicrobiota bacterium]